MLATSHTSRTITLLPRRSSSKSLLLLLSLALFQLSFLSLVFSFAPVIRPPHCVGVSISSTNKERKTLKQDQLYQILLLSSAKQQQSRCQTRLFSTFLQLQSCTDCQKHFPSLQLSSLRKKTGRNNQSVSALKMNSIGTTATNSDNDNVSTTKTADKTAIVTEKTEYIETDFGEERKLGLFRHTPLVYSRPLSTRLQHEVYLKLDLLQDSGSFKDRGMAHLCFSVKDKPLLVSSSGGNAGLAVATVAQKLGLKVHVYVPTTTKAIVIDKLRQLDAQVFIGGENWNAADTLARQVVQNSNVAAVYVSPYDDPRLWQGHSSLVDEIYADLPDPPGAIIASVGGGGLLCGILQGLMKREQRNLSQQRETNNNNENIQQHRPLVIAAETLGANSFQQTWQQQELVRLDAITSVATSLGALQVTPAALKLAQEYAGINDNSIDNINNYNTLLQAISCTDAQAINACIRFANDHRMLVEPACGAALAVLYSDLMTILPIKAIKGPIVVQVCGGNGVSLELLQEWQKEYPL